MTRQGWAFCTQGWGVVAWLRLVRFGKGPKRTSLSQTTNPRPVGQLALQFNVACSSASRQAPCPW